ncbi:MAG: peptide chain release factor 1 [Bacilli bacterium]|nr:peptide chain release factor 1 [Bacilli bacterium]
MIDRLQAIEDRYLKLTEYLCDPDIINDPQKLRTYAKEQSDLEETVQVFREYRQVVNGLEDAKQMIQEKLDDDMRELVKLEIDELSDKAQDLQSKLTVLLLPKDPNDEKNVIVEVRGAVGGEEAALFAGVLYRMYSRFAERQGWKTEMIDATETDLGGFKEITFNVMGKGAYSKLKFESGGHRVQRVPTTESGGRIHTSMATVAVLPEVEDVEVHIDDKDLRIDTFCSSGAGGQSVNTTKSAIRIVHIPTGLMVQCQDEKSQLKNKDKAMKVLRARLFAKAREEQHAEVAEDRKSQVGTGDRSERIRTYNYPQSRITDHRIGLTLHKLDMVLDGDLDDVINSLITATRSEQLSAGGDDE